MTQAPSLSIVAPCHNEEEGLREFCRRAAAAAQSVAGDSFELILVDDGSSDGTWEIISDLAAKLPQVLGVRLLRNHGHQLASTAGLSASRGERVLLIDADLQDPPELLLMMMPIMERGADVVYGQRTRREGESWFKLATASVHLALAEKLFHSIRAYWSAHGRVQFGKLSRYRPKWQQESVSLLVQRRLA